jgi:deazaflavin-dependent oxidoreductase (nitroreductase family)
VPERKRNPLINSAAGGRILSAAQLPLFTLRPPPGYGILTTTGRKTGKRRRRCVRAIRRGDRAYLVAIRGRTGWLRNIEAHPEVQLRLRGGTLNGVAREVRDSERREAMEAYCDTPPSPFEYLEYSVWRSERPTATRIRELHRTWFETGKPLVVELGGRYEG